MKIAISIFISFIFLFLGYGKQEIKMDEKKTTSLTKSEVVLDHGNLLLNNRNFLRSIVGVDSLLLFDGNSLQFVLYDLKSKKHILTISTPQEGPDFFDFPLLDFDIEGNQLYVLSQSFFSTYNLLGKNLTRVKFQEMEKDLNSDYLTSSFSLITTDSILFNKVPLELMHGRQTDSVLDKNIFFTYSISKGIIKELKVKSPIEVIISNDGKRFFQEFAVHNMLLYNYLLIYNYPFMSKTLVYNVEENKHYVKATHSNLVQNLRMPANPKIIPTSDWIKYLYTGPKFAAMVKDESSGFFARVMSEFETLSDGSQLNTKYLMILDSDLNVIEEIEIDERIMEPPIISNKKVYLMKTDQMREDAFELIVYTINRER